MSLTINSKSFQNDTQRTPDSYRYTGPGHTLSANDWMDLKRSQTVPTTDFAGMSRAYSKFNRAVTDGTDPLGNAIIDIVYAIPVGTADAEITALIDDCSAWHAHASFITLVKGLDINY